MYFSFLLMWVWYFCFISLTDLVNCRSEASECRPASPQEVTVSDANAFLVQLERVRQPALLTVFWKEYALLQVQHLQPETKWRLSTSNRLLDIVRCCSVVTKFRLQLFWKRVNEPRIHQERSWRSRRAPSDLIHVDTAENGLEKDQNNWQTWACPIV